MRIEVKLTGRDQLELELEVEGGQIKNAALRAVGCFDLLRRVQELRPLLKGPLDQVPLPAGEDHSAILLREILLKAKGQWQFPYLESELCHCRAIPAAAADEAIVAGAHTVGEVAEHTSAGTACGSCRPDTQKIIDFRLNRKAS